MIRIDVELDDELEHLLYTNVVDTLDERAMNIAAEEAKKEIDANFQRGGADSAWEPTKDGGKPLEGTGKLREAATEGAVVEIQGDTVSLVPGNGFPQEIADHLNDDREFMVIPKFKENDYADRISEQLVHQLKGEY